ERLSRRRWPTSRFEQPKFNLMLTFSAFDETEFGRSPAFFRKKEYLDGSTSAQERRSGICQLKIQSAAPCGARPHWRACNQALQKPAPAARNRFPAAGSKVLSEADVRRGR